MEVYGKSPLHEADGLSDFQWCGDFCQRVLRRDREIELVEEELDGDSGFDAADDEEFAPVGVGDADVKGRRY